MGLGDIRRGCVLHCQSKQSSATALTMAVDGTKGSPKSNLGACPRSGIGYLDIAQFCESSATSPAPWNNAFFHVELDYICSVRLEYTTTTSRPGSELE